MLEVLACRISERTQQLFLTLWIVKKLLGNRHKVLRIPAFRFRGACVSVQQDVVLNIRISLDDSMGNGILQQVNAVNVVEVGLRLRDVAVSVHGSHRSLLLLRVGSVLLAREPEGGIDVDIGLAGNYAAFLNGIADR